MGQLQPATAMLYAPVDEVNALNTRIDETVKRYEAAIEAIEQAGESISAEQVLELLVARSMVNKALKELPKSSLRDAFVRNPQSRRGQSIERVKRLNTRLNRCTFYTSSAIKLEDWRVVPNSSEQAWVLQSQKLSKRAIPWHDRLDWLWQLASVFCFGISFALLADIVKRVFAGGIDGESVFTSFIAALISLFSGGGLLTEFGQKKTEKLFTYLKIPTNWWDESRCIISLIFLLILFGLQNLGLPLLAEVDIHLANNAPNLARQEDYYQRAISLKPDALEAHLYLAKLYADQQEFDRALAKYKTTYIYASGENHPYVSREAYVGREKHPDIACEAAQSIAQIFIDRKQYDIADRWLIKAAHVVKDSQVKDAQMVETGKIKKLEAPNCSQRQFDLMNALGRIYVFQLGQPREANRWFKKSLDFLETEDNPLRRGAMKYQAQMYIGWTQLKAGQLNIAEATLQSAIALDSPEANGKYIVRRAPAHCLMAKVLEEKARLGLANQQGLTVTLEGIRREWELCTQYTNQYSDDESIMLQEANQRIGEIIKKQKKEQTNIEVRKIRDDFTPNSHPSRTN